MIPQVSRGSAPGQLMAYLVGEGRRNEHEAPHLVGGSPALMAWHSFGDLDHEAALEIAAELDQTHRVLDVGVKGGHVWHCSLSIPAQDGVLTDDQWELLSKEFMHRMGFVGVEGKADTPWVAVRHGVSGISGNDHVHVVASLVREDGTKADVWQDYQRAQDTCRELEKEAGLTTVVGDYSPRVVKNGEPDAARARGRVEPERVTLERVVRACSVASRTEDEFVRRLRGEGLRVRASYTAEQHVRGYSVALEPAKGETPIHFSGSKLGRDLGLGTLRARWHEDDTTRAAADDEWRAATRGLRVVAPGREQEDPDFDEGRMAGLLKKWQTRIEGLHPDDKEAWRSAAADLSGVFAHWSRATEPDPGPLAAVSTELSRSAQLARRESRPVKTSNDMGAASSAMLTWMVAHGDAAATLAVFRRLSSVAAAIRDHHESMGDSVRTKGLETVARERLIGLNEALHARAGLSTAAAPERSPSTGERPTWSPPKYEKQDTKHGQMTR